MKAMEFKKVSQSQIIKISLLVAVLVSLSKTLFIYRMIDTGKMDLSGALISDLLLQLVFFFLFSWGILQLSANGAYTFFKSRGVRIAVTLVVGTATMVGTLKILEHIYPLAGLPISREEQGFLFFKYVIILISLIFVGRILRLQLIQKESALENERLKQQNLQNELTALKNQIDPHFLFNSLNSLNCLIRDNEEATAFVSKLSFMYRYILQSGDRDLVTVKEELKFLESYAHLIKARYRNRFSIEISIDHADLDKQLPPLALQSMVENAVKHNEISETNPLIVKIFSKDDAICVENPIRPRTTLAEGTGSGLANLQKRYFLLAKRNMTISTENQRFSVELPFLKTT
jgi:sensor histidine kinase YesM